MSHDPPSGHTLPELCALLVALGIALLVAVPALAHARDGLAVRAARDALLVEAARARLTARARGGAALTIDAAAGRVWTVAADGTVLEPAVRVADQFRVRIDLGGATATTVPYDRLGIGRLANRTIRLVRNDAEARVTVSAYGRVRAW